MKAKLADKRPPRRSFWVHLTLLAVLAGALGFYFTRGKGTSPLRGKQRSSAVKSSYKNRALLPAPEAPAAEDPPALPVIRGVVYDTDGATLAGAALVALTYDVAGNVATRVADAASDAQGRFEIPLRDGTYQVNVSKEGYGPSTVVAQTGETASVILPRSGKVTGHVVDEKGKPVRRFTLELVSAVPGDVPAPPPIWTKSFDTRDGTFEVDQLPSWPVVVRAAADDLAPAFSKPVSAAAGETREVTLTLTEGCTLRGKVVDKSGLSLPRVLVNVEERLNAASTSDPAIQASMQSVTGDDGGFVLEHVARGSALLRGYDGDNAPTTMVVEIRDCDKLAPVTLVMSPGGSLEGTARGPDNKPIQGARVTLTDRSIGIINTVSDEDGRYLFEDLPPGVLRVSMEHDGKSAMNFAQIREGVTSRVDLTLFPSGTGKIEGRVLAGKKPVAGARLLVAANHGRAKGIAMYFPVTSADGTFTVASIPIGAYLISVMSTSAGTGLQVTKDEVAKTEIDVGAMPAAPPPPDGQNDRPRRRRARQNAQAEEAPAPAPAPNPSP